MAAMEDAVVGVGRGSNRREEKRKHNISLTHTCTTCCLCLHVWHAGGGGHGLLVMMVMNTSNGVLLLLLRFLCALAYALGEVWDMCVWKERQVERSSDVEVIVSQISGGNGVSMWVVGVGGRE